MAKKKISEKQIETAILDYLSSVKGCFAWKNNSTGVYDPVKKTFRLNRGKYLINGVSDILGIFKGKPLAIEVKTKTGRLTENQKVFLNNFKKYGGLCGVARSIDDAMCILNQIVKD